ncbi:MAG: hypothetical protein P1U42_05640 [Phycisphaerales bacterium]|nr:hypothetical protein [Phycisphaerales bacterium]
MNDSSKLNPWQWAITHSPILHTLRWMRYKCLKIGSPNQQAKSIVLRAELPIDIENLIVTTTTKSKLWSVERVEIARELIAHAQDAIEAGRTSEEISEQFGDPKRVAKLMRRSMKRKRPLYWRTYRNTKRVILGSLAIMLLFYGSLAFRFYTGKPKVRSNYIADLNALNEGYSEDQKSWKVLMDVGLQWGQQLWVFENALREQGDDSGLLRSESISQFFQRIDESHPEYDGFVQLINGFEIELTRLREAATREVIGLPVGFESTEVEWEGRSWTTGIIPATNEDYKSNSMIGVLLPHLGNVRRLGQLLVFDSHIALIEDDVDRYVQDLLAAMGLVRQVKQEPYLISKLVGIAIHKLIINELHSTLKNNPGLLNNDQIVKLAHLNAEVGAQEGFGMGTERISFYDLVQRMYTDDGNGNGHLTSEGINWLSQYSEPDRVGRNSSVIEILMNEESVIQLIRPISIVRSMDRKSELRLYNNHLNSVERVVDDGPEYFGSIIDLEASSSFYSYDSDPTFFSLAKVMMPALGNSLNRYYTHKQECIGLGTMLAIESFRLKESRLPERLDDLVPGYLPRLPTDYMDPGQSLKYNISTDGYVLYSIGSDGDDDGGKLDEDSMSGNKITSIDVFSLRFQSTIDPKSGLAQFGNQGQPILAEPVGPDGDWILFDSRHMSE